MVARKLVDSNSAVAPSAAAVDPPQAQQESANQAGTDRADHPLQRHAVFELRLPVSKAGVFFTQTQGRRLAVIKSGLQFGSLLPQRIDRRRRRCKCPPHLFEFLGDPIALGRSLGDDQFRGLFADEVAGFHIARCAVGKLYVDDRPPLVLLGDGRSDVSSAWCNPSCSVSVTYAVSAATSSGNIASIAMTVRIIGLPGPSSESLLQPNTNGCHG